MQAGDKNGRLKCSKMERLASNKLCSVHMKSPALQKCNWIVPCLPEKPQPSKIIWWYLCTFIMEMHSKRCKIYECDQLHKFLIAIKTQIHCHRKTSLVILHALVLQLKICKQWLLPFPMHWGDLTTTELHSRRHQYKPNHSSTIIHPLWRSSHVHSILDQMK